MNCEQVDAALDVAADGHGAANQAVQRHLASCKECREAWTAYRELAAERVPPLPRRLAERVHAAVDVRTKAGASRARVTLAIGAVLVVGAAAAAGIAWRIAEQAQFAAARGVEAEAAAAPAATEPLASSTVPQDHGNADVVAPAAPPDSARFALDLRSVVVLHEPDPGNGPGVAAELERCRDDIGRELRAAGFNVIAGERVTALARSGLESSQLTRELGAATAVVVRAVLKRASCQVEQVDARSGAVSWGTFVFLDPELQPDPWAAFAKRVAEQVKDSLRDPSTVILEAQAAALDTALSDEARVAALSKLQRGPVPSAEAFDPAVVAAALQIATHSRQAEARARAWQWIRRLDVHDPLLAPPLLAALADDPAPEVRRVAALMLGSYLGEPGVADALAQAVAHDPDDRPTQSCCVPTVRETARRALLFAEEPHAVVRKILLDESLPPHDRLMLYGPDGVNLNLTGLGDDAARAVFAIGANAADADIRQTAWLLIKDVRDPSFTRVLLDDLARHPSGDVRAAAAAALTLYRDAPGVSAALERAQRDPVDAVQQAARAALAGDRGMSFGRP